MSNEFDIEKEDRDFEKVMKGESQPTVQQFGDLRFRLLHVQDAAERLKIQTRIEKLKSAHDIFNGIPDKLKDKVKKKMKEKKRPLSVREVMEVAHAK